MEKAQAIKAGITAFFGALTIFWGWLGWLVIALIAAMTVDYITGWAAARSTGIWLSKTAKKGLAKKVGIWAIVAVAACIDLIIGLVLTNIPGLALPFVYSVLVCPIVILWYLLAEMGSIIENAVCLGAACPPFVQRMITMLKSTIEKTGDKIIPSE